MNKTLKVVITTSLLSLLVIPITYFVIYPNYNKLIGPIKRFDIQRYAEEINFQLLTSLSPTKDVVLGASDTQTSALSMEESVDNLPEIKEKVLEDQDTEIIANSAEIDGKVFEGSTSETMMEGFWHFPLSQLPGEKGNFVVIGHRYAKLPPNTDTFFNLDKIKVGDRIVVRQKEDQFTYIVTDTREVEKNDLSVLQNFNDYRLTLITCSPLWTSEKRLVVTAKLDKLYKNT